MLHSFVLTASLLKWIDLLVKGLLDGGIVISALHTLFVFALLVHLLSLKML